jgi:predicted small secreted protein
MPERATRCWCSASKALAALDDVRAPSGSLEIGMNIAIRKLSIILVVAAFVCATTACNTMSGLGKDTAVVGEKIEKEAERHIDDEDKDGA